MTLENVEPTDEEPTGNKQVSLRYMEGLLKNVHQSAARKMLDKWITRTKKNNSDFVDLSPREHEIYVLVKNQGGFKPEDFSYKNYPVKKSK